MSDFERWKGTLEHQANSEGPLDYKHKVLEGIADLEARLAAAEADAKWLDKCRADLVRARTAVENQKYIITDLEARLAAAEADAGRVTGETSDGYHTFNELYEFRKMYNAALFNEWAAQGKYQVHKSHRHHDGECCFGGGWFIVVAILPSGQISNHYENADWDLFHVPAHEKALFEYDGHTSADVLSRLQATAQEDK
jgi:acyl-homoserine lactone acylase PvdQ